MDNEPEEVIKHQMRETRASLAEKLETLEQQVVGTVHTATSAVTDTVETVKDAVQQTVEMAKASVHETVGAVKDTFDLSRQVRQHPWLMMGGSVSVGFAAGCLLGRAASSRDRYYMGAGPSLSTLAPRSVPERDGGSSQRRPEDGRSTNGVSGKADHGFLSDLGQQFEGEIHKLKGLALGTMFGVVRDMIASSAPPQLSSPLAEVIDSVTVKLGGQPVRGPVLSMFQQDSQGGRYAPENDRCMSRNPVGATPSAAMDAAGPID